MPRRRNLVAGSLALVTLGLTWRMQTQMDPGRLMTSYDWYDGTISTYLAPGDIRVVERTTYGEPVRVLLVPSGVLLLWSALGASRPPRWVPVAAAVALVVAAVLALAQALIAPTVAVVVAAVLAARSAWPGLGRHLRRWASAAASRPSGSTVSRAPG